MMFLRAVLTNGDLVVVVNGNQVAQLQVTGSRASLRCDTLHHTSITQENVGVIVDKLETRLVEDSGSMRLCDRQTNCIRDTLTQRTCSDFNTRSMVQLRVTWRL